MPVHFEKKYMLVGVDIGGSHITAGIVNANKLSELPKKYFRKFVNAHSSEEEILNVWCEAIKDALPKRNSALIQIGIAMPGPFDYASGVCRMAGVNKYASLYGKNIKKELSDRLNIPPENILMRNDAEAFLAGEMLAGAGRGFKKAIGVTLGTGLGAAAHSEQITKDVEMGINTQLHDGVAEDYISTRWCIKRYSELTGKNIEGVKFLSDNIKNDNAAKEVLETLCDNLTMFLAIFIEKEFLPEVVVLGGNIVHALTDFLPAIQKTLQKQFPKIILRQAELGENAALIGAASLCTAAYYQPPAKFVIR